MNLQSKEKSYENAKGKQIGTNYSLEFAAMKERLEHVELEVQITFSQQCVP